MFNTQEPINLDSIAGIQELDDALASQCRGGGRRLSLRVTAGAGESAAGAITSNGAKAAAGNGEVVFGDNITFPSFTFPIFDSF